MNKIWLTAQLISLAILGFYSSPRVFAKSPNILLILADDLGYGDVGCYNPECRVPTPNLDRLAAEGMRFTDAHSPATVCTPTRYSIMTGRMAFRLNYRGVFTGVGGPCLITADRLTLPSMLHAQGYETAMFGKWHIGMSFQDHSGQPINENGLEAVKRIDYSRPVTDGPIHRGFDHFFGTVCCPTTDWLYAFMDGDRIPTPPERLIDTDNLPQHAWSFDCRPGFVAPDFVHEEVDQVFLQKSLSFLDAHTQSGSGKPFFLFHSTQAVHLPSFPGRDFVGKTSAGPHGDFIFEFDDIVGQLLQKLDQLGLVDDTLVIVTSDNGPEVGTVLNMREKHQHDGARPWRGMKRDNWEGGHRVPMLVRWPGTVPAGTVASQTVCLTDIMATCAAITGYDLPNEAAEDSVDFSPVLLDPFSAEVRQVTVHQTMSLALAIRQGDWKYLDHRGSGGNDYSRGQLKSLEHVGEDQDAPSQLYNLRTDPAESKNLLGQHPEIATELKAKLEEIKSSGRSAPRR
ncbi:MAG: sulfatase-like hydrolase/transferase [Planctomycetales bacterium]|nr:sulfatase-like hydrolase/transferase [Planctomycetales bacterium]